MRSIYILLIYSSRVPFILWFGNTFWILLEPSGEWRSRDKLEQAVVLQEPWHRQAIFFGPLQNQSRDNWSSFNMWSPETKVTIARSSGIFPMTVFLLNEKNQSFKNQHSFILLLCSLQVFLKGVKGWSRWNVWNVENGPSQYGAMLTPVMPATQEADIRRISAEASPTWAKVSKTSHLNELYECHPSCLGTVP
jgi:hypothetical protein